LFYRNYKLPGAQDALGQLTPTGIHVGLGVRVQSTQTDFTQGAFETTGNPLDVAIVGDGFYQVLDPSTGLIEYTRSGDFSINSNGQMVVGSASIGRQLTPPISIPQDATGITISPDGSVMVTQAGNVTATLIGNIQLTKFINPQGLLKLGENLYQETIASGSPILGNPGQQGLGTLQQNTLERSNVETVEELVSWPVWRRSWTAWPASRPA
jgi:flagellar basal-body rod protein FlgG